MARIRTIKPEFFTSEDIVRMTPYARLLYIALWCEADKAGRLCWKPATFKMRYMPGDSVDINALCQEIIDAGLVVLYGDGLAHIPTFSKHQHVNPRETASKLPDIDACPRVSDASILDLHAQVGREGKGKEGKGIEALSEQSPDVESPEPAEDRRKPAKRPASPEDESLAARMFGLILVGNPTARKPNLDAWADDIRLMREVDNRAHPDIWSLFQWVRKDSFWRANILSPAKLREKWDQLTEKRLAPAARGEPVLNEKFNFNHLDRSGDARAMAASMARHGITTPAADEEIEI